MAKNMTYSVKERDKATHDTFIKMVAEEQFLSRSEAIMEMIRKYVKRKGK